ncbi:hypothetical protein CHO01_29150 [Cellulomonas hominis]|uniref:Uncharacterized protein n=1 Tax=Cellulomonas hominis TaxID=156981 RepID=A0A511FEW9_9CELL|nr:hypothetical protein [Cellulomonas hominis]MBB5474736.1 hypothetical protein [Cellulomonas hominis]NKY05392.1 hypothetical protein [Cellulomonas hominis]GEL47799.1 hypothetical protein CHO01_29150 [Cellulomonas hominis]
MTRLTADGLAAHPAGPPAIPEPALTEREEISVALRYIGRARSMLPSPAAIAALDEQEAELRARLAALDD